MTNLEKLTAGEIAAENNGTLEQLREVIGHCFPMSTSTRPTGGGFIYSKFGDLDWMFYSHTPNLPTIPITQLWEELQALKKPEIWWIRVTEDNKEVLGKWVESLNLCLDNIVGMYRLPNGNIHKGCILIKNLESETYDFGNEIDFATFLKYTGVEVEPKPTNSGGLKNEIVLPEKWRGEIEGLPAPILKRMMECQVEQGNKADYTVFENWKCTAKAGGGFDWAVTAEKSDFWTMAITYGDYSKFFEMYPETKPEKVEKSLEEKISEVKKLIDHRGCLLIQFDVLKDEINGIETKLSALLK